MAVTTNVPIVLFLLLGGISRSDTMENVLKMQKEISEQNIKEIVLTGVNIGDYGKGNLEIKNTNTPFRISSSIRSSSRY